MQTNLKRGKAALRVHSARLTAIVATASIVATFSFLVSNPAQAGCGGPHIAGAHGAPTGTAGIHATTGIAAPSGGGGSGGVGNLGCAGGSSASPLRGLPTAASGRIVEGGNVGRREAHTRTAPTRTNNATAHLHTIRPAHRA